MRQLLLKICALVVGISSLGVLAPVLVQAQCNPSNTQEAIQCGSDNSAGVPTGANANTSIDNTINNGINLLSLVIGVVAVVMIVLGGFRYITSSGRQETVAGAKSTIIYAIIGLVIVALAQAIARFVLKKSAGA